MSQSILDWIGLTRIIESNFKSNIVIAVSICCGETPEETGQRSFLHRKFWGNWDVSVPGWSGSIWSHFIAGLDWFSEIPHSSAVLKVSGFLRDNFFVCQSLWSGSVPRILLHTLVKAISLPAVVVKIKNCIPEIGPFPNNIPKKSTQKRYHTWFN